MSAEAVTEIVSAKGALASVETLATRGSEITTMSAEMRPNSFGFGTVDFKPQADNVNAAPSAPALSA